MAGAEFPRESAVEVGSRLVHPLKDDALAALLVLRHDGIQCRDSRGIPDVRVGHVDDNTVGIVGVLELGGQVAMGELMQDPVVSDALGNYSHFMDPQAIQSALAGGQ